MTPEEVLSIQNDIPSFRFFYDNIRSRIVQYSDEYERIEYKSVSYKSMYKMFKYWESDDYKNDVASLCQSYESMMSRYQTKIDSISQTYKSVIDKVKDPSLANYNYSKIFNHPELCYFYSTRENNTYCQTFVTYILSIKDRELFDQIGFKYLNFDVKLTNRENPEEEIPYNRWMRGNGGVYGGSYKMTLYDGTYWDIIDPHKSYHVDRSKSRLAGYGLYSVGWDMSYPVFDANKTKEENFLKSFDWLYEVADCVPSYNQYLKSAVPESVYYYWMYQEQDNVQQYIHARNQMIRSYCDADFVPLPVSLPRTMEAYVSDLFPNEYYLYSKAKGFQDVAQQFESMFDRENTSYTDWIPSQLTLPISNPNGNYVMKTSNVKMKILRDKVLYTTIQPREGIH